MEFADAVLALSARHQAACSALNCEKMMPSVAKFDEQEAVPASSLFEKATAAIYAFALGQPAARIEYEALKEAIEA